MSRLFYSDEGHVIPTLCEEVSGTRRAMKVFNLPATSADAALYLLARPHSLQSPPLSVFVNGHPLPLIDPAGETPSFLWYTVPVQAEYLQSGENRFEVSTSGSGMNAWTLAFDLCQTESPGSFLSTDGGRNWLSGRLGLYNRFHGEYVLRVRLAEGSDPQPPACIHEDFSHPRLAEIRAQLPPDVTVTLPTLDTVRLLSTWTALSWEYCSSAYASLYTPWDAATILGWGKARQGQNGQRPVVMCVHYAIVFITACQSLGIYARPLAFTEAVNGFNGHFAAEVWIPELQKWVFVDPNVDAIFFKDGVPLSVSELRRLGSDLAPYARFGPGYDYQIQNPSIQQFMQIYLNGRFMKRRALWPRTDFLSHPELTPPGHGSLVYCESAFVWEPDDGLEMFPYFGGNDYFAAQPAAAPVIPAGA